MRGEYSISYSHFPVLSGSPPLARGVQPQGCNLTELPGITPACAGSTGFALPILTFVWDHPRLRGEYVDCTGRKQQLWGSPPLARGVRNVVRQWRHAIGITPACAGSTGAYRCAMRQYRDHPRLRGEYLPMNRTLPDYQGSPPLARGVHQTGYTVGTLPGITPACAGSTQPLRLNRLPRRDHPRLRGEYIPLNLFRLFCLGSPPLARGVLGQLLAGIIRAGITPACAGSTSRIRFRIYRSWDHPRLRGEYIFGTATQAEHLGSPPLARGVLVLRIIPIITSGITPACAGSTFALFPLLVLYKDHPRLRGEYQV